MSRQFTREEIIARVQKLLAFTKGQATDGEIDNAMAAARKMMADYHLNDTDLADAAGSAAARSRIKVVCEEAFTRTGKVEHMDQRLVNVVCNLFDCRGLIHSKYNENGKKGQTIKLYGLELDVQLAIQFLSMLRMEMRTMARLRCGKKWSTDHRDYCTGFCRRLEIRTNAIVDAPHVGAEGLTINKRAILDAYEDEQWGAIGGLQPSKRRKSRRKKATNHIAQAMGDGDAMNVDLGRGNTPGGGRLAGQQPRLAGK